MNFNAMQMENITSTPHSPLLMCRAWKKKPNITFSLPRETTNDQIWKELLVNFLHSTSSSNIPSFTDIPSMEVALEGLASLADLPSIVGNSRILGNTRNSLQE